MRNFANTQQKLNTMTNKTKQIILTGILLMIFSIQGFSQYGETTCDNRVKTKLDDLGIKYEINSSGNFKLIFKMENERTQLVIINSETYQYGNIEVREIYSRSAFVKNKTEFTQQNLFYLLQDNSKQKIGAWQIDGSTEYSLNFSLRASANTTSDNLDDLIRLVAKVADEMEQKLTKEDKN